jgi:hypothetical protein
VWKGKISNNKYSMIFYDEADFHSWKVLFIQLINVNFHFNTLFRLCACVCA